MAEALAATFQLACTTCSLTRFPGNVGVVEILEELGEERIAVGGHRFLDPRKDTAIHALRVVGRLEQVRGTPEMITALLTPLEPYFQVACHLASSHGETDQAEIMQLEVGDQLVKILCKRVVVVACAGLAGLSEASAVVSDDPVTLIQEDRYLLLQEEPLNGYPWISTTGLPEPWSS